MRFNVPDMFEVVVVVEALCENDKVIVNAGVYGFQQ